MFGLKNRGETLIFMSRHFDETMTILISHFLRFGAQKILTGDYFELRINQIIYSKQKIWCFIHFSIFPSTFPTLQKQVLKNDVFICLYVHASV